MPLQYLYILMLILILTAISLVFQISSSVKDNELDELCQVEAGYNALPDIRPVFKADESGSKYFEVVLASINKFDSYWVVDITPPIANAQKVFYIPGSHSKTLRTDFIPPTASNSHYVLRYSSNFSFSYLSSDRLSYLAESVLSGSFPVSDETRITQVKSDGLLSRMLGPKNHQFSNQINAVDIAAPKGAAVLAFMDGEVVWVNDNYQDLGCGKTKHIPKGNMIIIKHHNGTESMYLHLAEGSATVTVGDYVLEGSIIAKVGNSGGTKIAHLHFQVQSMSDDGLVTLPIQFRLKKSTDLFSPKYLQKIVNDGIYVPH